MAHYPNMFFAGGSVIHFANFLTPAAQAGIPLSVCQVGAFVGDASVWLMENVLTHPDSVLYDVDPWTGWTKVEAEQYDWEDVEATYNSKMEKYKDKLLKFKMHPDIFFTKTIADQFDFVFINGSKQSVQVLKDITGAFNSLKEGGLICVNGYNYGPHLPPSERPKEAVDCAIQLLGPQVTCIEKRTQAWMVREGW